MTKIFTNLVTGAEGTTVGKLLISGSHARKEVRRGARLDLEDIDPGGDILVQEIRLRKAQVDLLGAQRNDGTDPQVLAASKEISLANVDVCEGTVGGREADTQCQLAGRLLLHLSRHDRLVGRRTLPVCHFYFLEEA